jgi:hypothetical protein
MKVYGRNHIYPYVPDYLNNRRLPLEKVAEQIVVNLKVITAPEEDAEYRASQETNRSLAPDVAQEKNEARLHKLYKEKYAGVTGLEVINDDGTVKFAAEQLSDFDLFYAEAPQDIVREALRVMRSAEALTVGEQKNFLPESGGR